MMHTNNNEDEELLLFDGLSVKLPDKREKQIVGEPAASSAAFSFVNEDDGEQSKSTLGDAPTIVEDHSAFDFIDHEQPETPEQKLQPSPPNSPPAHDLPPPSKVR